jgi:hypothetical protein
MRKLLMGSIVLTVFSLSIILFQFSCKKDVAAQTTTPAPTKDEILAAKTWRMDKLHHVISGQYSSYTNGGTNTTGINYDNLTFKFNANGTGVTTDQNGASYNLTWQFTSTDKRSLQLTATGRTDNWEMVEISENYLHASVNLILGASTDNIETFRLKQIP